MALSEEAVNWAYRFMLGRLPESPAVIATHMQNFDEGSLINLLMQSEEYKIRNNVGSGVADFHTVAENEDELWHTPGKMRIVVVGNCHGRGMAKLMPYISTEVVTKFYCHTPELLQGLRMGQFNISYFMEADLVLVQSGWDTVNLIEAYYPDIRKKSKALPIVIFNAFQPDCVHIHREGYHVPSPIGPYGSSLAFYSWKNGFSPEKTISLYNPDVYEALGFFDYWDASVAWLNNEWERCGIPLGDHIANWSKRGCWMHTMNHPKLFVLADVARAALAREGISTLPYVEDYIKDDLGSLTAWPVYPEIGRALGMKPEFTSLHFKRGNAAGRQVDMLGLEEFVHGSFEIFETFNRDDLTCDSFSHARFENLAQFASNLHAAPRTEAIEPVVEATVSVDVVHSEAPPVFAPSGNPYRGLADYQFWRRAIERPAMKDVDSAWRLAIEKSAMHTIDPVLRSGFKIDRQDKVATAGSCFAQHISRTLQKKGFNYFISEKGDLSEIDLTADEAQRRNYGVFSARFGNIYTARQLLQLFDRAYGHYTPEESYWVRDDGKLVDPFRPQVEPEGFTSIEDLNADREKHFASVRDMFESLDVLVFTLGLTESWQSRTDGAVFPLAPGVVAGEMDTTRYEFVNFQVADVVADLKGFIGRLLGVNPKAKMLITVSPVPLIATYEDRHVLVSTTYSKSALRAAAEEISLQHSMCEYFPSYEIITGSYTRGEYFESDLRSVKPEGVEHVMRLFLQHYASDAPSIASVLTEQSDITHHAKSFSEELLEQNARLASIVCDEEALDR
ncbi:GSCFA domain-containing protein [Aquirhabdus sp.]|uniref:GSCFA domain-containing protein n=1 Tax=Aquirhabdus sp. TaxID=2824160 RepID=UPI00396C6270